MAAKLHSGVVKDMTDAIDAFLAEIKIMQAGELVFERKVNQLFAEIQAKFGDVKKVAIAAGNMEV